MAMPLLAKKFFLALVTWFLPHVKLDGWVGGFIEKKESCTQFKIKTCYMKIVIPESEHG